MASKIDIDRFICYLIESSRTEGLYLDLNDALEYQGLTYRNGKIVEIDKPPLTEEQKAKFKVGDWVVYTGNLLKDSGEEIYVMQVASVEDDRYNFTDTSTLCFDSEKDMRSWTIQDAKEGDVLCAYSGADYPWIGIFYKLNAEGTFNSHCYLQAGLHGHFCPPSGKNIFGKWNVDNHSSKDVVPATKEQRDLLFQKMEKAGYKWNQEELKLEKIDIPQTIKFNKERVMEIEKPESIEEKYNIDIDKMVEDFKEQILISQSLTYDDLLVRTIAYKSGLIDMLKVIKGGE